MCARSGGSPLAPRFGPRFGEGAGRHAVVAAALFATGCCGPGELAVSIEATVLDGWRALDVKDTGSVAQSVDFPRRTTLVFRPERGRATPEIHNLDLVRPEAGGGQRLAGHRYVVPAASCGGEAASTERIDCATLRFESRAREPLQVTLFEFGAPVFPDFTTLPPAGPSDPTVSTIRLGSSRYELRLAPSRKPSSPELINVYENVVCDGQEVLFYGNGDPVDPGAPVETVPALDQAACTGNLAVSRQGTCSPNLASVGKAIGGAVQCRAQSHCEALTYSLICDGPVCRCYEGARLRSSFRAPEDPCAPADALLRVQSLFECACLPRDNSAPLDRGLACTRLDQLGPDTPVTPITPANLAGGTFVDGTYVLVGREIGRPEEITPRSTQVTMTITREGLNRLRFERREDIAAGGAISGGTRRSSGLLLPAAEGAGANGLYAQVECAPWTTRNAYMGSFEANGETLKLAVFTDGVEIFARR